jgi:serine/threonine protein kinase
MAEVYVAKTKGIGGFEKLVAIKVIHPRFSEDGHFVQMLVEEAKISVQLNHVNIAQTFDLGCIDDTYYIAMEFVEGADTFRVEKRAKERRIAIPIDICCYIAAEVCNGLGYAHRKRDADGRPLGIVHRDISPQNVLVSHSGEVKLVDFGIAKAALRSGQTEVGVIKGKYYYMSPEQAWGDPVDQRTDIFATGLLLYELLTGEMVYREESNVPALLDKVRKARIPSPRARRKDVPPDVEAALMKAVAKEVPDRFQSAHAFGQELTRCLYQINPTFTASRLGQLMATLFPEEVRRHSQVLKLPLADLSGELELPPLSRDEFTPSVEASVIFDLDEADESTRNDILPFRHAKLARAAQSSSSRPTPAPPSRSDRATRELARPGSRTEGDTTAQLEARKDEWDEETVLRDESWEDDPTVIEDDGRAMKEVMRLLGARAMAGDGDGELAGEKTVATTGAPLPAAAEPPAPAPRPPARPLPPSGQPGLPPAPQAYLRPPTPPAPAPVQAQDEDDDDLEGEETVAFRSAVLFGSNPPPELGLEAPAFEAAGRLPPENTVAWDQSSAVMPPPRRSSSLAGPSQAGIRLGQEAERFFSQSAPSLAGQSPFDPFGGAPSVEPDPFPHPPPSADPFIAQPPIPLHDPQPRRWPIFALAALVVVLLLGSAIAAFVALRHRPTMLEIISVPEGAAVELDGRSVGQTPVSLPEVEAGRTYRVQLQRAGYEPRSAELNVVEGPNRSVFLLNQVRVTLHIDTHPAGAQVWVDNVLRGTAPLDIPGLAAGQRVLLRSSAPGHESVSREVTLSEDDRAPRVVLELPAAAPR